MNCLLGLVLALSCSCHARHIYKATTDVGVPVSVHVDGQTEHFPETEKEVTIKPLRFFKKPVKVPSDLLPQALETAENLYGTLQKTKKPKEPAKNGTAKVVKRAINHEDLHIDLTPSVSPFPTRELVTVTDQDVAPSVSPFPTNELITVTEQERKTPPDLLHQALRMAKKVYHSFQKIKTRPFANGEQGYTLG
ncbi:uncharacterized protein O3C94_007628 [Discoglossus pictus]